MSKQVAEAIHDLANAIRETFGDQSRTLKSTGTIDVDTAEGVILVPAADITETSEGESADLAQFKAEPEVEREEVEEKSDPVSPAKLKEAVRNALGALQAATDPATAKALLKSFNDATSIGKLNPDDYEDVIKACEEAVEDA